MPRSNRIGIFRRVSPALAGPPSATLLFSGELAFNEVDNILYYGRGRDAQNKATQVLPIGGPGAFIDKNSTQDIAGLKIFAISPTIPASINLGDAINLGSVLNLIGQAFAEYEKGRVDVFVRNFLIQIHNENRKMGVNVENGLFEFQGVLEFPFNIRDNSYPVSFLGCLQAGNLTLCIQIIMYLQQNPDSYAIVNKYLTDDRLAQWLEMFNNFLDQYGEAH